MAPLRSQHRPRARRGSTSPTLRIAGGIQQPLAVTAGTRIVTLEEFAAVEEEGAAPIVGADGAS